MDSKKGRPRQYLFNEIENPENIIEVDRIIKDKYSSQYYQDHKNIKVQCPICLKTVQKYTIGKHQRTKYCLLVASVVKEMI
jgi:hypothetical protein